MKATGIGCCGQHADGKEPIKTLVAATTSDGRDTWTSAFFVLHDNPELNVADAVREAAREWIATTDDGRKAWEETCCDFNWGDMLTHGLPEEICKKHGFILEWDVPANVVVVDHDEVLC